MTTKPFAKPLTSLTEMLDGALAAARMGIEVFPLHGISGPGLCTCDKQICDNPGKHPRTANGLLNATTDEFQIRKWWKTRPTSNVGARTGGMIVALDVDDGEEGLAEAREQGVDTDAVHSITGNGAHFPFRCPEGVTLRNHVKETGNWPLKHCDTRGEGGYIVLPPSRHANGAIYGWSEPLDLATLPEIPPKLLAIWREPDDDPRNTVDLSEDPDEHEPLSDAEKQDGDAKGEASALYYVAKYTQHILRHTGAGRNNVGLLLALQLRDNGISRKSAERYMHTYWDAVQTCRSGKEPYEWMEAVNSLDQAYSKPKRRATPVKDWVKPMADTAYYGVLGHIVKGMARYIETDTSALMVNMLVTSGASLGHGVYLQHGAGREHTNLYAVVVAVTGENKSDSYNPLRELQRKVQDLIAVAQTSQPAITIDLGVPPTAPDWGGLSTGEGLLWQLRDEVWKTRQVKDPNDSHKTITEEYLADAGATDKRLLVIEGEFGAVLTVMYRDSNILSTTLRNLYDGHEVVRSSPKNNAIVATGAHVGLIAMVTPNELHRKMRDGEVGNGFVNRVMWPLTKRLVSLPHPDDYSDVVEVHAKRWMKARKAAEDLTEMKWDLHAKARWTQVYECLRKGTMPGWPKRTGLAREALSRVHTWVIRLAMIYAAFDGEPYISTDHLEAALAVAEYCERCGVYLFAKEVTDSDEARLLDALRVAEGQRMTRTDVSKLFSGHKNREKLTAFLVDLENAGRIQMTSEGTGSAKTFWIELVDEDEPESESE